MNHATIVGTGSWGTTLAILVARKNLSVSLLTKAKADAKLLKSQRENSRFVPGHTFPRSLQISNSAPDALSNTNIVILAVPAQRLRENCRWIAPHLRTDAIVVSAAKGLEVANAKRMSEILLGELPEHLHSSICVLSGPNLATEILEDKPSSSVVASTDIQAAKKIQELLTQPKFRVYTSTDVIGVEFGGALKNIIAIGAGVCDGLGLGNNTKAAFLTRGLAEITRLAVAAGAQPITLAGLAGMGDLVATSYSNSSRNHFVGEQLAKGISLPQIRSEMVNVAEGIDTAAAATHLATNMDVDMPITKATFDVMFNEMPLGDAIAELLLRAPAPEWDVSTIQPN